MRKKWYSATHFAISLLLLAKTCCPVFNSAAAFVVSGTKSLNELEMPTQTPPRPLVRPARHHVLPTEGEEASEGSAAGSR